MKPGDQFGPYRVERALGRGGMAETFVATRDLGVGSAQEVCLKRMLPGLIGDRDLESAFEAEARLAADLVHSNIATLIDHGRIDDIYFLALELVEGVDLRILLREAAKREERLPYDFVAEIAFGLGHALEYAHARSRAGALLGVVHRDISPSNVLLGTHAQVKLADFGIAKVAGASHHTRTGLLKGKIPYMPPEYITGGAYDARGDLFALGVTLFECVAGSRPFDGTRDVDTLHRIAEGSRRSLDELAPRAPVALRAAIESLIATNPDDRPRDARAFLASLHDVAPPASTRAALAEAVARLHDLRTSAREPTVLPTRRVTGSVVPDAHVIVAAGADESTRTRAKPSESGD